MIRSGQSERVCEEFIVILCEAMRSSGGGATVTIYHRHHQRTNKKNKEKKNKTEGRCYSF